MDLNMRLKEREVINRSSTEFKQREKTCSGIRSDFKLNRTASLLLYDHGSGSDFLARNQCTNFQFNKIAST